MNSQKVLSTSTGTIKKMKLVKFVQRKRALGDVLWIEPLVRKLAEEYRQVYVYSHYAELFENYPASNVHFNTRVPAIIKILRELARLRPFRKWFLNLDDAYERSPRMHILQAYFNAAGYPETPLTYPRIFPNPSAPAGKKGKQAIIHLDAPSRQKNFRTIGGIDWMGIRKFLEERKYEVVGISADPETTPYFSRRLSPSLRELAGVINECDLFIGLDSGPSHIAASLGKPCILFFGSVNPWYRHLPDGFKGVVMQQACPHAGCYHEFLKNNDRHCLIDSNAEVAPCCRFSNRDLEDAIRKLSGE